MSLNGATPIPEESPEVAPPNFEMPPPQPTVNADDMAGRITELSELNAALMARCATLRGQIAMKDRLIDQLKR